MADDVMQDNESFFFKVSEPSFMVGDGEGLGAEARDLAFRGTASRHFVVVLCSSCIGQREVCILFKLKKYFNFVTTI